MNESVISISSVSRIPSAGKELLGNYPEARVFAFFGEMGAGKTTIIKEMCRQMGVGEEEMSSPTFALINEYHSEIKEFSPVYHFDFYRIKNETEAFDMGYEDYFYSGNYCFIEWAEKIPNLLPRNCVKVQIVVNGPERKIFAGPA